MPPLDHVAVAQKLAAAGFYADVRSDGSASFIFATHGQRVVEISAAEFGIWVEYWDGDDSPVRERTFATGDEAADDTMRWLAQNDRTH
jgi:hypothetical protein